MNNIRHLFSGCYDSTKQAVIRDEPEISIGNYKIRMKLDILFSGMIVLTDAQYYDGAYFHYILNDNEEKKDFFKFLNNPKNFICVKRRLAGVVGLFNKEKGKGFYPSAMKSKNDAEEFYNQTLNIEQIRNQTGLPNFIKVFSNNTRFKCYWERVRELNQLLKNNVETWTNNFQDGFPEGISKYWSPYKDSLINKSYNYQGLINLINNAEDDLKNDRGKFHKKIDNLLLLEEFKKQSCILDLLHEIRGRAYQSYNYAQACQHACNSLDVGEIPYDKKSNAGETTPSPDFSLDGKSFKNMMDEKWVDFQESLADERDDSLGNLRKKWLNSINPQDQNTPEKLREKCLHEYITKINKIYSTTNRLEMKWDFIGGGSSKIIKAHWLRIDIPQPNEQFYIKLSEQGNRANDFVAW